MNRFASSRSEQAPLEIERKRIHETVLCLLVGEKKGKEKKNVTVGLNVTSPD